MTTENFNNIKDKLEDMSISDLGFIIREALVVLFKKLRDNGFSSNAYIQGQLDDYWPDIYIVGISSMSSGDTTSFGDIHKI